MLFTFIQSREKTVMARKNSPPALGIEVQFKQNSLVTSQFQREWRNRGRLSAALRFARCLALGFRVLFHCFALFFRGFFEELVRLLGGLFGVFARVASPLCHARALGPGRRTPSKTQSRQQDQKDDSFHDNFSCGQTTSLVYTRLALWNRETLRALPRASRDIAG
jgi:hypothetical protein